MSFFLTRRQTIYALLAGTSALAGCSTQQDQRDAFKLPEEPPNDRVDSTAFADNVDALADLLLPAERDGDRVTSPGAREAGFDRVLEDADFAKLLQQQGLLPPLPDAIARSFDGAGGSFRRIMNAALDAWAARERALTSFRELPPSIRATVVDRAFDDPALGPALSIVRAACFAAFLGAEVSDVGLREVGFPPFESFEDRLAVSGYPRTKSGRVIDAAKEDLGKLAAAGDLDDYTYNRAPAPTAGDDLSAILTPDGDLL